MHLTEDVRDAIKAIPKHDTPHFGTVQKSYTHLVNIDVKSEDSTPLKKSIVSSAIMYSRGSTLSVS